MLELVLEPGQSVFSQFETCSKCPFHGVSLYPNVLYRLKYFAGFQENHIQAVVSTSWNCPSPGVHHLASPRLSDALTCLSADTFLSNTGTQVSEGGRTKENHHQHAQGGHQAGRARQS